MTTIPRRMRHVALIVLVAGVALAGCGTGEPGTGDSATGAAAPSTEPVLKGTITVSAASSLTQAFEEIGTDFETANPGVHVTFNFDSSSTLATQILEGAPADAFASADAANMAKLTDKGLISGKPEVFARNELVVVTKPGNPKGIDGLADLASAGVISLCAAEVPCGKFAQQALDGAGVAIPEGSVTRGQNVKAALTAVTEGDAVAGIVYVTDALAAGGSVKAVKIPAARNVIATYPIGVLAASANPTVDEAFMAYVLGDKGQAVLRAHGFLPPG